MKKACTILLLAFIHGYRQVTYTYNKHRIVHAQPT